MLRFYNVAVEVHIKDLEDEVVHKSKTCYTSKTWKLKYMSEISQERGREIDSNWSWSSYPCEEAEALHKFLPLGQE
jgi:hypothetical protein